MVGENWRPAMPPAPDEINCPRCHELATKRLLAPEDLQMMTKAVGDVFLIDCRRCGSYECKLPQYDDPERQ